MTDLYADLVGTHEIAEMAGVNKNVIVNWSARYDDFPKPVITLAMGRAWRKQDVEAWLEARTVIVPTRTIKTNGVVR